MMGVSLTTTVESLGDGLDLLVDAVTDPSFEPEDLELERRVIQLKIEREALKKDTDKATIQRLENLEEEIEQLEKEYSDYEEQWLAEKLVVQGSSSLKEELENARMAVHGSYDERATSVITEWNPHGLPVGTRVEIRPVHPLAKKTNLRWDKDADELARIGGEDPYRGDAAHLAGRLLRSAGRTEESIPLYGEAAGLRPDDAETHPLRQQEIETLDGHLASSALSDRVRSLRLWSREGEVIYSPYAKLIGQRFPVEGHLAEAWAGEVVTEMDDLSGEENEWERQYWDRLLEMYIPVRERGTENIIAVAEFYLPPRDIDEQVAQALSVLLGRQYRRRQPHVHEVED